MRDTRCRPKRVRPVASSARPNIPVPGSPESVLEVPFGDGAVSALISEQARCPRPRELAAPAPGVRGWCAEDRPARDYNATTNPGECPRTAAGRESNSAGQTHYRRTPCGTGRDRIALLIRRFGVQVPGGARQTHCSSRCCSTARWTWRAPSSVSTNRTFRTDSSRPTIFSTVPSATSAARSMG